MNVPPLPPGWTQHTAPTGHIYYHNASTNESSYVRPILSFATMGAMQTAAPGQAKKDKPLLKTPIPGTDWIRVKTTQGNTFYSNKATKASLWTTPDDIRDAVRELEEAEAAEAAATERARTQATVDAEVARIKGELQEAVTKRKAGDLPASEVKAAKKPKVASAEADDDDDDSEEGEEEEWQKEAIAQLAAEAEAEKQRQEEERTRKEQEAKRAKDELEDKARKLGIPSRSDLSVDEAKAFFRTMLQEKDINPMLPWDMSLPLFVTDPRYTLLSSVTSRREVFDDYCRVRARELREKAVKEQRDAADPKDAFERLLKDEVKSTRASWTDFRRQWKKDRRFYGWGRDDREREKRFREFLKELGERKRAEAQKAEADFFTLLRESGVASKGEPWSAVKGNISKDPRYDAVGSSSLREELYHSFLKARGEETSRSPSDIQQASFAGAPEGEDKISRQARKERAVKEREAQVKVVREKLEADIDRSKLGLSREEGDSAFRTMLTDAIRDPQLTWDAALPQLRTDPRFTQSPLPPNQQMHLFQSHILQLRAKHLDNLRALFESHAPSLATPFGDLPLSSLLSSLPATKLGYDDRDLEAEYDKWHRERNTEAKRAFDQMLGENAFVEFWGRLGKMGGEGVNGGVKADEEGEEDDGTGGGGKADMKQLAKSIDLKEMQKVLKHDRRYTIFDHAPEARERWLRDYLEQLSAPKLSVHVPETV